MRKKTENVFAKKKKTKQKTFILLQEIKHSRNSKFS